MGLKHTGIRLSYILLRNILFFFNIIDIDNDIINHGVVPFSSVGRARVPCAEALQRTWVRLPARVPLLCVTPPPSHPVSCHSFSCTVNKAMKRPKNSK